MLYDNTQSSLHYLLVCPRCAGSYPIWGWNARLLVNMNGSGSGGISRNAAGHWSGRHERKHDVSPCTGTRLFERGSTRLQPGLMARHGIPRPIIAVLTKVEPGGQGSNSWEWRAPRDDRNKFRSTLRPGNGVPHAMTEIMVFE